MINNLFHAIIDIERVSDHAENMSDLAKYKIENGITFSQHAMEELKALYEKVVVSFSEAVKAREKTKPYSSRECMQDRRRSRCHGRRTAE